MSIPQLINMLYLVEPIKTSTLDYNGERDLSSIINCVIFRLWGSLLLLLVCLPFAALAIEWLSLWCVYFTDSVSAGGWFYRLLAVGCDPNIYAGRLHISRPLRSMPRVTDWVPRESRPSPFGWGLDLIWVWVSAELATQYTLANSLEIVLYMCIQVLLFYDDKADGVLYNNRPNWCVLAPSKF